MLAELLVAAMIAVAGPAQLDYTVQPSDTLEHIARRHSTSVRAIAEVNGIADVDRIVAGRTLTIPSGGHASAPAGSGGAYHVVLPGESLWTIGRRYGVPPARLAEWNGLGDEHLVMAGSRLAVGGPAAHAITTSGDGTHRVRTGETLSHIALRAGVSVDEIVRVNGIADANRIVAGSVLTIPGGGGWQCPVSGPVRYVNDFGVEKPDGRFHDGIDLYAAGGTPVVAPVAGRVEHAEGSRAGLQFRLHGVDGHVYVGTHLDSFGASGQVRAGEVVGTVGSSGNALGTAPHLHFEVHAEGRTPVNPYQSLRTACG